MSRWKTELTQWGSAVLIAVALAFAAGRAAYAQGQEGFLPATEIARESLPAAPLVYMAYALVWIALIAYIFLLWQRLNRVERELKDVSARLAGARRK
jgi:CcmD family protein